MAERNKSKGRSTIFPLFRQGEVNEDHPILKERFSEEPAPANIERFSQKEAKPQNSVWPADPNIVIEDASFENTQLTIKVNNTSFEPIVIKSAGVKYTNSQAENIGFQPYDFELPPGESFLRLDCPKGKPYKFVFRTANMTGAGSSLDSLSW